MTYMQERTICKSRHASYLFNEMSKFQKCGLLCDVTIPGQLHVVPAHRVVLESARSSLGDRPSTPTMLELKEGCDKSDDVFWIDEAYSSGENEAEEDNHSETSSESVEHRLGALDSLRRHHYLCDVTLEADLSKCDAHKVVLAACSGYFRAMFTSRMKERDMDVISLQGVDGSYFKRVLEFIYSGELVFDDWEDGLEMLKVAVYYQIPLLVEMCCNHLLSEMEPEMVCVVARESRELALKNLSEKSLKFVHDHFLKLDSPTSQVGMLPPADLCRLLQSNHLGHSHMVGAELSVFRIVLRWLLSNPSSTYEDRILTSIRFSLIPPDRLTQACGDIVRERSIYECSASNPAFSAIFRKHLHHALQYHDSLYRQPLVQTNSSNLRSSGTSWLSIDGVMTPYPLQLPSNSEYIASVNNYEGMGPIRDPFHSLVVFNGFVYVLGGTRLLDEGYSRQVIRYDPRLDKCCRVADMLEARGDFVALQHDRFIYAIGGRNCRGALKSCERYDPDTNTWEFVAELPEELYMAAGIVEEGLIYITGGFNNYETVGFTFCYHPLSGDWEQISSPMMCERGYHVITKGPCGNLWVIGGVDNPFSGRNVWEVEAFDVTAQRWNYIGQILPVKLLLSTIRLNVFHNTEKQICISAVTNSDRHPVLKYIPESRMWLEENDPVPSMQLDLKL